ncbi:MAG: GTPase ObgE [Clostridiaceae bacterium]|nr:GTPase ObgE [Clostridiaceae bacterium]
MFIDSARIQVKAGDGGDGQVSFHTAKYVPNGGPDGGDGGRGGSVIFIATAGMSTLQDFRYHRIYAADSGEKGGRRKQYGRSGADLRVKVPVGTLVKDAESGKIIADLTADGQEVVIARGGHGGKGNVHFVNSVRQAPKFARAGAPGEQFDLLIELKLLADVGLIGMPNAGKSTLLSVVSSARPKIADYPFTTIEPNLGVVAVGDASFVMADIPGLIEGAHIGLGLGLSFLKHVERTRLLLHILDLTTQEGRDPIADFDMINHELASYDERLASRPQIVALNKTDMADDETIGRVGSILRDRGYAVYPICAPIGEGIKELIQAVAAMLQTLPVTELAGDDGGTVLYQYEPETLFTVEKIDGVYRVKGAWIENLVQSTNFDDHESLQYFQRLIRKKGVIEALEKSGVREGDLVALDDLEFEYIP